MKACTYCGKDNDDATDVCPQCGMTFRVPAPANPVGLRALCSDPVSRFRVIVVLGNICYLLYVAGPWVLWTGLSGETQDALAWRGFDAVLPQPPIVFYLTTGLWIIAAIGVYFFIHAARLLYTALVGFSIFNILTGGLQTALAVESFLIYLSSMADGATLVLAYWTPLSSRFEKPLQPEERT